MPGTEYTRNQILTQNTNDFPNNNAGLITPAILRDYNTNVANSVLFLNETGSHATSASYALSASYANNASTSDTSTSASYALTASYALNAAAAVNTGSLLLTASISNATVTFTKGDNSTFSQIVNNVVNANTASAVSILDDNGNTNHKVVFVNTAVATSGDQLLVDPTSGQFTYNPSSNLLTVTASLANQAVSSSYALTASYALNAAAAVNTGSLLVTASVSNDIITFTKGNNTTFDITVNNVKNSITSSVVSIGGDYTNTDRKIVFVGATGASIGEQLLINASTPDLTYNPTTNVINATASFANQAVSSSYAVTASYALNGGGGTTNTGSLLVTASAALNVITFTKGDSTTFDVTVDTGSGAGVNTGSLLANASATNATITFTRGDSTTFGVTVNNVTTAATASTLSGLPSNAFARIGANNNFTASVGITLTSGSRTAGFYQTDTLYLVRGNLPEQGTREFGMTNRLGNIVPGFPTTSAGLYISTGSGATTYKAALEIPNGLAWGSINLKYRTQVTGGFDATNGGLTGSLEGSASYAVYALSASYAPGGGGAAFPFTGSADITGSLSVTGSISAAGDIEATASFISVNGLKGADLGAPSATIWSVSNQYPDYGLFFVEGLANDFYEFRAAGTPTVQFDPDNGRVIASQFTGSLNGTATSASYITPLNQQVVFTGSVRGEVSALSIASNTASLDCSLDNFFTLQLVQGTNTYINPTNVNNGQTINILVNTTGSATVSFPSTVKQISGNSYTPTSTTAKDVLTLISFNDSNLYLVNVKNLV